MTALVVEGLISSLEPQWALTLAAAYIASFESFVAVNRLGILEKAWNSWSITLKSGCSDCSKPLNTSHTLTHSIFVCAQPRYIAIQSLKYKLVLFYKMMLNTLKGTRLWLLWGPAWFWVFFSFLSVRITVLC